MFEKASVAFWGSCKSVQRRVFPLPMQRVSELRNGKRVFTPKLAGASTELF